MRRVFVNFSNHHSSNWNTAQKKVAQSMGEIIDIPFPTVMPNADKKDISILAEEYAKKIEESSPDVVMCQGEFTLCFAVVTILQSKGIKCVAACSERKTAEKILEDGSLEKTAIFEFVKFREY